MQNNFCSLRFVRRVRLMESLRMQFGLILVRPFYEVFLENVMSLILLDIGVFRKSLASLGVGSLSSHLRLTIYAPSLAGQKVISPSGATTKQRACSFETMLASYEASCNVSTRSTSAATTYPSSHNGILFRMIE